MVTLTTYKLSRMKYEPKIDDFGGNGLRNVMLSTNQGAALPPLSFPGFHTREFLQPSAFLESHTHKTDQPATAANNMHMASIYTDDSHFIEAIKLESKSSATVKCAYCYSRRLEQDPFCAPWRRVISERSTKTSFRTLLGDMNSLPWYSTSCCQNYYRRCARIVIIPQGFIQGMATF